MSELKNALSIFNELSEVLATEEKERPVASRIDADVLYNTLDLSLNEEGLSDEKLKEVLGEVIASTPKTATNLFFNQLFGGRQSKAMLGDLLAVLLNNSMYTYKVAGPQVGIEQQIIRQSCDMIGYGKNSNGTFPTGGSMSNYMGLIMGRDAADPEFRHSGPQKKMVIYATAVH